MKKKEFNEKDWILKSLAYNLSKLQKRISRPDIDTEKMKKASIEAGLLYDEYNKNPGIEKKILKEKSKIIFNGINDEDFGLYLATESLKEGANLINGLRKSGINDRKLFSNAIHNVVLSIYFSGSLYEIPYERIKLLRELKPLAETGMKLKSCGGKNRLTEDQIKHEREEIQDFVNDLMQRRGELSFTSALELAAKEFDKSLSTIKRRGIKRPS